MTRRRPAPPRGFTLLELLCATAIMAMLALSLYASMRIGFRARDRALAAVGPARSAEVAMDLVRRDLESALPPRGLMAGSFFGSAGTEMAGTSQVYFYGVASPPADASNYMGYAAGGSAGVGRTMGGSSGSGSSSSSSYRGSSAFNRVDPMASGGVKRIELLVRPPATPGGEPDLVRRVTHNLLAATEPVPDEEVLCRGVTAFAIRYYDGTQWYDEWDSTQYGDCVPMAVEVVLEVARPQDPTRTSTQTPAGAALEPGTNTAAYRTSRIFFLPCRDETTLLEGGTQ
jgi:prepilin-type N-terminal cleavage/methylation domain-containing protein